MTTKARIELTATDRTREAFRSVERNLGSLQSGADRFARVFAGLGGVLSLGALVGFARNALASASALDDMAEATGASVEGLSKLSDIARIGGKDVAEVETALVRLTKALSGADEETQGAGAALRALGLDMAQLRAQSPDRALEQVAQAFARFEDGAGKTSAALALFGRSGAQLLPLLNDIAEQSERVTSLTADQAKEAEKLEKQWNALSVSASNLGRSIMMDITPSLIGMIEEMREGMRIAGGFGEAIRLFGVQQSPGKPAENIRALRAEIAKLQETPPLLVPGLGKDKKLADLQKRLEFERFRERQEAIATLRGVDLSVEQRRLNQARGSLPFISTTAEAAQKSRRAAAKDDDPLRAQRLALESLGEQAAAAADAEREISALVQRYRELYDPAAAAIDKFREFEQLRPILQGAGLDVEAIADTLRDDIAEAEFGAPLKDLTEQTVEASAAAQDLGMTFSSAFEDAIVGGKKLGEVLEGLAQDVARIFIRRTITEPLAGGLSDMLKGVFPAAAGAVFEGPGIGAYSNSIVDRPTLFPAAEPGLRRYAAGGWGLMGEAGPEAVMPLARDASGRLGVRAQSAAPAPTNVTVAIENRGAPQQVLEAVPTMTPDGMVIRVITDDLRRGGPIAGAIGGTFGLRRGS